MSTKLTATLQDYLEAIFHIEAQKRVARVRDISGALSVSNSTVTAALRSLAAKGLVNYEPYQAVTLTPKGGKRAKQVVERHRIIGHFLRTVLNVEPDLADSNACRMEHAIDDEVLERFLCFLAFAHRHQGEEGGWIDEFRRFRSEGTDGQTCKECVMEYLKALHIEFKNDMSGS